VYQISVRSTKRSERGVLWGSTPRLLSPGSDNKVAGILDLIHFDVCGPMSSVSSSGFVYYVTFIDDFSKKSWIFIMKTIG
jgi:hypothetical protein